MTTFKAVAIGILIVFAGCLNVNRNNIDYIIYGQYFGECVGHCAVMFKFENSRLIADTTDSYFKSNGENIKFQVYSSTKDDLEKALAIKQQIPTILFESDSRDFGTPDDHDQGGIYIELKKGGTIKRFHIDRDLEKIPAALRDYARLIMQTKVH